MPAGRGLARHAARDQPRSDPAGRSQRSGLRVTVLCGGPSAERAVSLESGRAVADALRRRGHRVFVADVSPDDLSALDRRADVVFPALHGTFGEDGALQSILEQRGIRFVGSGSAASALAMDKVRTKRLAAADGVSTPAYFVFAPAGAGPGAAPGFPAAEALPPWTRPVVVKPVDQGSSVLTSIVHGPEAYEPAVRAVVARYGRALIEDFVAGDELTVALLDGEPLPPICVRPKRGFYDYEAKYHDERTEYLFDCGLPPEVLDEARRQSARVYARVGCRHLARIDWIADRAGRLWMLEVNTLPGFTSHSLLPMAAARAGIPFDELVDRLTRRACEAPS